MKIATSPAARKPLSHKKHTINEMAAVFGYTPHQTLMFMIGLQRQGAVEFRPTLSFLTPYDTPIEWDGRGDFVDFASAMGGR